MTEEPRTTLSIDWSPLRESLDELANLVRQHSRKHDETLARVVEAIEGIERLPAATPESTPSDESSGERPGEPAPAAADANPPQPQPVVPQPVVPQPVAQQPIAQQPIAQQPIAQQPIAPQPVAPQPVAAQPVAPQIHSQSMAPLAAADFAGDAAWASLLIGAELAEDPHTASTGAELLSGLRAGEPGAESLVGHLLVFRSSTADRMAQLLKDVGEAYYRWRPESAGRPDGFRDALVDLVLRRCEAVGVNNRIELVQPGDRFDSARHHAKQRGMEVVEVYGWVVLRENGKVYTKASVAVR